MTELPPELLALVVASIGGFITYLVTNGIVEIGEWFEKDFSATAKKIAALVSASVIALSLDIINIGLVSIPPEYVPVVSGLFGLIVALLTATGIHRQAKPRG